MKVCIMGEDVLRQKAVPLTDVTDETRLLIEEMFDTMVAENGVGLAAPQIGKSIRLFVLMADDNIRRVFINPQIIATSAETCSFEEGCLSVPKIWESIIRPAKVTVQALNEQGKPFVLEAEGYLARIIQHEYDHLEGILFIDRGDPDFKKKAEETFARREQRRLEKEKAKASKQAKIEAKKERRE
ncbi:MAG TPA: peptide deformylase [Treponemataceae bacterium]|jgi:peptide deformylase|nr:peptide deformylase [Treponemataceae bacterium]